MPVLTNDPLTGLPIDFVRMLAVKVDPFNDTPPNKPLNDFFRALMRAQSFRDRPDVTESFAGNGPGNNRPEEGRQSHD